MGAMVLVFIMVGSLIIMNMILDRNDPRGGVSPGLKRMLEMVKMGYLLLSI
jgi:hypothetical protein